MRYIQKSYPDIVPFRRCEIRDVWFSSKTQDFSEKRQQIRQSVRVHFPPGSADIGARAGRCLVRAGRALPIQVCVFPQV